MASLNGVDLSSVSARDTDAVSAITLAMEKADDLADFQSLMNQHEEIISRIIRKTTVRESLFGDFSGSVKSLGAWGGDFILAASDEPEDYVRNYFADKDLTTLFNYSEVVPDRKTSGQAVFPGDRNGNLPQEQND
jgi:hypothetical protein